ncbi:MAG: beta-galactosidase [Verrucomicrobiota bacterium JB022]|nr:beta-galactosidase [Verrucomicrobiota bacterium JB022]
MILPKLSDAIAYGGDYNPEQWTEDVWLEDMRLMVEAGVNLISVGIFSWSRIQPDEDTFDFAWLDRVLDLMAEHKIGACLATATASPPPWLSRKYPDVLPVTDEGVQLYPGSRQHYSPSSPSYRRTAANLVRKLAERYRDHPALAAWHINNEYACHMPECHSEWSTVAFREWLRARYGTIEALNEAWGCAFWSQLYSAWDQIFTPRKAPYSPNPAQQLDFKRFTSDAFLDLLLMEKAIVKEVTPDVPVNTNFMSFFKPLDYQRWAQELDFTSWDSYPDPVDEEAGRETAAIGHDLTRSLKPGKPFVLMEQASSAVNWRPTNMPKRPGLMRLWSLQSVARGADGVMFFQWRASKAGAEKYHSAMLQHCGAEKSRVFKEVKALGAELKRLHELAGSTVHPRVAIAFDWHSWWALELDARPGRIDLIPYVQSFHHWFYQQNIAVDFVHPGADLSSYQLVVAPALYLLKAEDAKNLEQFVERGGSLLTTYFSGIVDENDRIELGGYPAHLRKMLGIWVEEWCPYPADRFNTISFTADVHAAVADDSGFELLSLETARCSHWCDILHLEGAKPLATFGRDFFEGRPALTQHNFGKGHAYYLATRPDEAGLDLVLRAVTQQAQVEPVLKTPSGIEATLREKNGKGYLCLLNHTDTNQIVSLHGLEGRDLINQRVVAKKLNLAPLDVRFIALD